MAKIQEGLPNYGKDTKILNWSSRPSCMFWSPDFHVIDVVRASLTVCLAIGAVGGGGWGWVVHIPFKFFTNWYLWVVQLNKGRIWKWIPCIQLYLHKIMSFVLCCLININVTYMSMSPNIKKKKRDIILCTYAGNTKMLMINGIKS